MASYIECMHCCQFRKRSARWLVLTQFSIGGNSLAESNGWWMVCRGFELSSCWLESPCSSGAISPALEPVCAACSAGNTPGRRELCPRNCERRVQKRSSKGGILIWIRAQGGGIIRGEISESGRCFRVLSPQSWTTPRPRVSGPGHHDLSLLLEPNMSSVWDRYTANLLDPYHSLMPRLRLPYYIQDAQLHLNFR